MKLGEVLEKSTALKLTAVSVSRSSETNELSIALSLGIFSHNMKIFTLRQSSKTWAEIPTNLSGSPHSANSTPGLIEGTKEGPRGRNARDERTAGGGLINRSSYEALPPTDI